MDAAFQALDFPGLDWGGYSRDEVLDLLTEAALDSLDGTGADFAAADQPRVPAGSPEGGQFGSGGGGGGASSTKAERGQRRAEKEAAVRAKLGPERIATVRRAVTDLLPQYQHVTLYGKRVKALDPAVPENDLVRELDRRGLSGAGGYAHRLLDAMVFIGELAKLSTGAGDAARPGMMAHSYRLPRPDGAAFAFDPDDFLDAPDGTGADFVADQPRVPAGSPAGGQFGPGSGGGTKAERSAARVERKRAAKAKDRQASGRAKNRNDALAAAHEAIAFAHGFMPKLTGAAGYFLHRAVDAVRPDALARQPLARKAAALRALRDEATRTAARVRRDPAAVPAAARPDVLNGLREIARRADRAASLLRREAKARRLPGVQSAQFAAQAPVRFTPLDSGESDSPDTPDPAAFFALAERDGAAAALAAWEEARFYSPDQPRDDRGRWSSGGGLAAPAAADPFRGGMAHGTRSEARTASAAHVREFVAKGGPATGEEVAALGHHLARLTVAQLHDLRREHGLPAAGAWRMRRPDLVNVLAERFTAHRAGTPTRAARELAAAVQGNPVFTESKYKPSDATHAYTHTGTGFRASAHPDGRFHVFGSGLTHEGVHDTAAAAVAHAANPPAKPSPDYRPRTADVETAARQGAVADAAARREAASRPAHEMTRQQYLDSRKGERIPRAAGRGSLKREGLLQSEHKNAVNHALQLGHHVPVEVLADLHRHHALESDNRKIIARRLDEAEARGEPVPAHLRAAYPSERSSPAAPGAGGGAGPKAGGFDAHAEGQALKALADTHVGGVAAAARSAGDFQTRGARVSEAHARAEAALVGRVKDLVARAPHAAALKDAVRAFGLVPVGSGKAALGEQLRTALLDRLNIMTRTATSTRGAPAAGGGAGPKAGGFDPHAEARAIHDLVDRHVAEMHAAARQDEGPRGQTFHTKYAGLNEANARAMAAVKAHVDDLVARAPNAAALRQAVRAYGLTAARGSKAEVEKQLRDTLRQRLGTVGRIYASADHEPDPSEAHFRAERPVRFVPFLQPAEASRA